MSAALALEGMSLAEINDVMKALSAAKKTAQDAEKARYAELGRELVETVLTEQPCEPSPTSTRVGRSTSSLPIEVDGRTYTFYISIKDVAASEQREKDVESGAVVLEKPKRGKKATEDSPTDEPEASADEDTTVVTLPTKPAA